MTAYQHSWLRFWNDMGNNNLRILNPKFFTYRVWPHLLMWCGQRRNYYALFSCSFVPSSPIFSSHITGWTNVCSFTWFWCITVHISSRSKQVSTSLAKPLEIIWFSASHIILPYRTIEIQALCSQCCVVMSQSIAPSDACRSIHRVRLWTHKAPTHPPYIWCRWYGSPALTGRLWYFQSVYLFKKWAGELFWYVPMPNLLQDWFSLLPSASNFPSSSACCGTPGMFFR